MTTKFIEPGTDATYGFQFYSSTSGTVASDSTANTGPKSIKLSTGNPAVSANLNRTGVLADAGRRISFYFMADTAPSSNSNLCLALTTGASICCKINLNSNQTLGLVMGGTTANGSTVLSLNTWYKITLSYVITSSSVNDAKVFIGTNSSAEASIHNASSVTTASADLRFQAPSAAGINVNYWFDDIYVDDGTGFDNPGDIRVTSKLPNANNTNSFDTAVGSNPANRWTNVNERALSETNGWQDATEATNTFGYSTIGGSTQALGADSKIFSKFTTGTDIVTVVSISAYLDRSASGSGYAITAGIYTDNSGAPNALVANSSFEISTNIARNTPAWYTGTYVTAHSLSNSTTYWIGVIAAKASISYYDSGTTNQQGSNADTYTGGLADPFGTPSYADRKISCYVTYNSTGAAENYGIEGRVGTDADLTGATVISRSSWVWAKKGSGAGSGEKIFNNGSESSITLTTSSALYTNITDSATYPSDVAAVGIRAIAGAADTFLYECGMLIAYTPQEIIVPMWEKPFNQPVMPYWKPKVIGY